MNKNILDLSSLEKAIHQLKKSLDFCHSEIAKRDPEILAQFLTASIQGFVLAYELAIKMLRRKLEQLESSGELVEHLGFKELLRLGASRGLIKDPENWFEFREKRNITSHIYDENKAINVYSAIPLFVQEVNYLFDALTQRNQD